MDSLWRIVELLPRIDIHSSSNLPAILGQNYELYSSNNGIRPVYVQLSTSNVVYLRYDDDITKWVFSNRLNGGILYASTLSTSSETYPQHVSQDWTLHDDNSVINITFSSSGKINHFYVYVKAKNSDSFVEYKYHCWFLSVVLQIPSE